MQVLYSLDAYIPSSDVTSLTIGNFDGVHVGHLALLEKLCELGEKRVVLTFLNHPATLLYQKKNGCLTSLSHRLLLLEKNGVDTVILLNFTEKFSMQTPEEFLSIIKKNIPFSHLVLGYDARIGYQRKGDPSCLLELSQSLHFGLEYLAPVYKESHLVSSRLIREKIEQGDLHIASQLLGRPFSILSKIEPGEGRGRKLGFPTANLSVDNLCLPPPGVYIGEVMLKGTLFQAVANLGRAPTFHKERSLLLEVHLLNSPLPVEGEIEVIFHKFLRAERAFHSESLLQQQIAQDIQYTKNYFSEMQAV